MSIDILLELDAAAAYLLGDDFRSGYPLFLFSCIVKYTHKFVLLMLICKK